MPRCELRSYQQAYFDSCESFKKRCGFFNGDTRQIGRPSHRSARGLAYSEQRDRPAPRHGYRHGELKQLRVTFRYARLQRRNSSRKTAIANAARSSLRKKPRRTTITGLYTAAKKMPVSPESCFVSKPVALRDSRFSFRNCHAHALSFHKHRNNRAPSSHFQGNMYKRECDPGRGIRCLRSGRPTISWVKLPKARQSRLTPSQRLTPHGRSRKRRS